MVPWVCKEYTHTSKHLLGDFRFFHTKDEIRQDAVTTHELRLPYLEFPEPALIAIARAPYGE
jgi:hypothetical protein